LAVIAVRDNGSGIPASEYESIFRPFFSTKGSRGTGLGLPVSRKILREHGGDLTVQSDPGRQTEFRIRLPIKAPGSGSGSQESFSLQSSESSTRSVPSLSDPG